MYKVQIKGLEQGKIKLKDDSFAIGFRTRYGTVWTTLKNIWWLWYQNPHLKQYIEEDGLHDEDFIGRYLYITEKEKEIELDGMIYKRPIL